MCSSKDACYVPVPVRERFSYPRVVFRNISDFSTTRTESCRGPVISPCTFLLVRIGSVRVGSVLLIGSEEPSRTEPDRSLGFGFRSLANRLLAVASEQERLHRFVDFSSPFSSFFFRSHGDAMDPSLIVMPWKYFPGAVLAYGSHSSGSCLRHFFKFSTGGLAL